MKSILTGQVKMIWFGFTASLFFIIGFFILYKVPVCGADNPPVPHARASVIIPARNEELNLPALLNSLKKQSLIPEEVIVVDDSSEDNTALVAEKYGAKVIKSVTLPDGWFGKSWSCHQGAREARGDIFIFLDADTFLDERGFERILGTFIAKPGVLSISPYHKVRRFHEAFSAFFNLMQLIGMNSFGFLQGREPAGMFGPCLVISRDDYDRCGGHESVRGEILEHYALAGVLKRSGIPIRLFSGEGSLNVRMYPEGWKDMIRGWTKSFTAGAVNTPLLTMRLSIMWITGLLIAPFFLIFSFFSGDVGQISFWSVLYGLYVIQLLIQFSRAGTFPFWSALLYPLNLMFFLGIFSWAGYRTYSKKQMSWKGRNIG